MKKDLYKKLGFIKGMTFRYLLALSIVGALSIASFLTLNNVNQAQEQGTINANLSLRWRFLIDRMEHFANRLIYSQGMQTKELWRQNLKTAVQQSEKIYQALNPRNSNTDEQITNGLSPEVRTIFLAPPHYLSIKYDLFISHANDLIVANEESLKPENPPLQAIRNEQPEILGAIDALIMQYESEKNQNIERLKALSLGILFTTLGCLTFIGLLLFRPMVRRTRIEMQKLIDAEDRTRLLIDSSMDAIVVTDVKGTIIEWSPRAEEIFGWQEDEVLAKNLIDYLFDKPLHGKLLKAMENCAAQKNNVAGSFLEFLVVSKSGNMLPIELSINPFSQKEQINLCFFMRDITERKEHEEELHNYREHLENLLQEKTMQLEENYKKLKSAERMAAIGEMAAQLAHEIKNPLTGIKGTARILESELEGNHSQKELLKDLISEIQRLDVTVKNLLDYAKPLSPDIVPTNLREFLLELKESWLLQPTIAKHEIQIEAPEKSMLSIDLMLMGQVLNNLVLNAAQAIFGKGIIKITAQVEKDHWRLAVADSGHGIPREILTTIFSPFFTTKNRGTGLGLAIAKKNMEALHGSISVKSTWGVGTTFVLTLPLHYPTNSSNKRVTAESSPVSKAKTAI